MPPELGPQTGGEYKEEGEGNFFTKKVGPLPMWAIIAGVIIVLYVLYTKFLKGQTSTSQPAVQTNPSNDTGGTLPFDNLIAGLNQVQANEQSIASQLNNPSTTSLPVNPTPIPNNTPPPSGPPGPGPTYYSSNAGTGTGTDPGTGQPVPTPTSSVVNDRIRGTGPTTPTTPFTERPSWLPSWVRGALFPPSPTTPIYSQPVNTARDRGNLYIK